MLVGESRFVGLCSAASSRSRRSPRVLADRLSGGAAATRACEDPRAAARYCCSSATIGPGIIAASAGNDSGGISTYSVAGARYGYTMLWMMLAMTPSFMIVQEMAGRMGAVTGKGFAALIRERFGVRPTFLAMLHAARQQRGDDRRRVRRHRRRAASSSASRRYVSVPVAAVVVWLLVVRGSYRNVEKVLLALSAVFVAYIIAAFMAQPAWGEVAPRVRRADASSRRRRSSRSPSA